MYSNFTHNQKYSTFFLDINDLIEKKKKIFLASRLVCPWPSLYILNLKLINFIIILIMVICDIITE